MSSLAGTATLLRQSVRDRPAILVSIVAVIAATLCGMALVVGIGVSVPKALAAFADGAWGSPYALAASVNRALVTLDILTVDMCSSAYKPWGGAV